MGIWPAKASFGRHKVCFFIKNETNQAKDGPHTNLAARGNPRAHIWPIMLRAPYGGHNKPYGIWTPAPPPKDDTCVPETALA